MTDASTNDSKLENTADAAAHSTGSSSEKDPNVCPVCYDPLQVPITLPCDHKFCYLCVKGSMLFGNNKCPMCRCILPNDYIEKAIVSIDEADVDTTKPRWMYRGRYDGWWFYQNDHNDLIETAWNRFILSRTTPINDDPVVMPASVDFFVGSGQYSVDFVKMTQSGSTGLSRCIKRVLDVHFEDSKGVAGVKYVKNEDVPEYEKKYPDSEDDTFNPHYADSYLHDDSDSGSYTEECDDDLPETQGDTSSHPSDDELRDTSRPSDDDTLPS